MKNKRNSFGFVPYMGICRSKAAIASNKLLPIWVKVKLFFKF